MAVASTIFPPARSAKRDENQAIDPKYRGKYQDFDSCTPSRIRAWRLRASSAHSREAESDNFLSCAAKKNRGCRRRARDDARRRSHLLPSVLVTRVFCELLLCSDLIQFPDNFDNNTRFPDRTQSRIFPRNRVDFKSINKSRFESIRFKIRFSLTRALKVVRDGSIGPRLTGFDPSSNLRQPLLL